MRPTPHEAQALDAAHTVTPLSREDAAALSALPDLHSFANRHHREKLAATHLAWAAEEWRHRQLRLSLYRSALRAGASSDAAYYRVTALDTPTKRIRQSLITAHRTWQAAQESAFRLF